MHPDKLLEQAKALPEKYGIEAYSATIWELRRKGKTYRDIAQFLNERGVPTDHTAIYRLISRGNPLLGYEEGAVLFGDVVYELRKGRPLRSFDAGLLIAIKKKLRIIPLKSAAPKPAIWCEAHFELNAPPNHDWLRQICENLDIRWNPASPWFLRGRFGFELKFDGNLMAMVCETHNLEHYLKELGTAVSKTSKFFEQDKHRPSRGKEMLARRNAEILESLVLPPGESEEDEIEDSMKWNRKYADELTRRFQSIPLP